MPRGLSANRVNCRDRRTAARVAAKVSEVTSRARGRQAPAELALITGHAELVEVLAEFGAAPAELDPDEAMVAGCWPGTRPGRKAWPARTRWPWKRSS